MSLPSLVAGVPPHWVGAVRPFLQRADEFQAREPLVAYFLRTHVAFVCMQKRTKEDKEGTKFLMTLLDELEQEKKGLGDRLEGVDGRTVLTKTALMLFAKADDDERTGKANMNIVRIFYSSAILFEATEQFTDDGKMDNMAAEKCRYAKYIAARMKKSLDNNQPYVSPNKIEAPLNGAVDGEGGGEGDAGPAMTTAPPSAYMPKQPSGTFAPRPQPAQPPLPPPPSNDSEVPPPYTQSNRTIANNNNNNSRPTSAPAPAPAPTPLSTKKQMPDASANMYTPPPIKQPSPQPQPARPAAPQPARPAAPQPVRPAAPQPTYAPPADGNTNTPTPEQMIDAQRFARQAVSALQFYDHATARTQLLIALSVLDGKEVTVPPRK